MVRHDPLAKFIARRWTNKSDIYKGYADDILQSARIGLWKAILTYEPNGGASIGTWAAWKIRHEIQSMLYRNVGTVVIPVLKCKILTLNYVGWEIGEIQAAKEDPSYDAVDAHCDAPVILDSMTKHQQYISHLKFIEEATSAEIAEITHTTRSNVNMILKKIRDKHKVTPCRQCKWHSVCEMHDIKVCEIQTETS